METTLVAPRSRKRAPASALGKITAATMVIMSAMLVYLMVAIIGQVIPPLVVFAGVGLALAAFIATGVRWAPAPAAVVAVAMFVLNWEPMFAALANPSGGLTMFALAAILIPALVVGIIAGIATTVQNYRRAAEERRAPRGTKAVLLALTGAIAGAIAVAAMPAPGISAGIDPATYNALPALGAKNFEFDQKELRVKAGETVAMKLTNADGEAHFLDIDELNVHAPIPAGKSGLAVFKPAKPGTYTFYCHPHASPDKKDGMVGRIVVE